MAEGGGFEPPRRSTRLRDFQSRALGQTMRPFPEVMMVLAERVGFEPTGVLRPHRFSRAAP